MARAMQWLSSPGLLKQQHHLLCSVEMEKLGREERMGGAGLKCNPEIFLIFLYTMLFFTAQPLPLPFSYKGRCGPEMCCGDGWAILPLINLLIMTEL